MTFGNRLALEVADLIGQLSPSFLRDVNLYGHDIMEGSSPKE